MKQLTVVALVCTCACSTSEKPESHTDSTTSTQGQPASSTSATTTVAQPEPVHEEPDPEVSYPTMPNSREFSEFLAACPEMKADAIISIDGLEKSFDSTVYDMVSQYATMPGRLTQISVIENFLDADNLRKPRNLTAVVFLTEEGSEPTEAGGGTFSVTVTPTLAVFEQGEEGVLTLLTHCSLYAWNGEVIGDMGAPGNALTVGSQEVITGQSVVVLEYTSDGFSDIDHTVESTSVDWYGLALRTIVKTFSYTPHFKEHVGAGDGENASEYTADIDISLKKLNTGRLRLIELTTAYEMGEPINTYGEEIVKPDGVYAFNGAYYEKVKVINSKGN